MSHKINFTIDIEKKEIFLYVPESVIKELLEIKQKHNKTTKEVSEMFSYIVAKSMQEIGEQIHQDLLKFTPIIKQV